jgi:hypothetical protein
MPEYLIELYVPAGAVSVAGDRSFHDAAERVASRGEPVRYLRSIYVAADETCFVLLEAETIETAREVARLVDVPFNRVSEVDSDTAASRPNGSVVTTTKG